MPPKKKATPKTKLKAELVKQWNETMQHVDRVSDSEEECVQDTQEQWPPPAKQPPAKKTKTHWTHHV